MVRAGQVRHDHIEGASGPGGHRGVHTFAELVEGEHSLAHRALQQSGNVLAVGVSYAQVSWIHSLQGSGVSAGGHGRFAG